MKKKLLKTTPVLALTTAVAITAAFALRRPKPREWLYLRPQCPWNTRA